MTETLAPSERITQELTSWPEVEAGPGSRGEWAFNVGGREIGHLHGDHVLHIAFPKPLWKELHDEGRIGYHPVFPDKPGWGARGIHDESDVRDAIALLRLNYDRVTGSRRTRAAREGERGGGSP